MRSPRFLSKLRAAHKQHFPLKSVPLGWKANIFRTGRPVFFPEETIYLLIANKVKIAQVANTFVDKYIQMVKYIKVLQALLSTACLILKISYGNLHHAELYQKQSGDVYMCNLNPTVCAGKLPVSYHPVQSE